MAQVTPSHPNAPAHLFAPSLLKWVVVFVVGLALSVSVAASFHIWSRQTQVWLDRGDAQRADYLYFSAAESYRQAARLDPRDAEPLLRLGDVYIELQQYVDAAEAYAQASQRGGTTPAVHAGLARALEGNADWAGAVDHWQDVITRQPDDVQARLGLARVWIAQEKWDEASATLAALLERRPDCAEAHVSLGGLLALDEPDLARAHFQAASNDPFYGTGAADWLNALDSFGDAAYRAAQLGRLFLTHGDVRQARRAFERAVELNPAYAEARAYLGQVLDQLGSDGGDQLAQAVESAPESVIVRYLLGVHLRRSGDLAGARVAFEEALARDPSNAALATEIGLTILQERAVVDYIEGETWLVKAAELEPDNPAWAKQLARFYLDYLIFVKDKGVASAQQAVYLAPDDADAHDLLGWAYYLTGELPFAHAELQRALEFNPRHAAAHYHLAAVLMALGQPENARRSAERAASLDPAGSVGRRARQMMNRE